MPNGGDASSILVGRRRDGFPLRFLWHCCSRQVAGIVERHERPLRLAVRPASMTPVRDAGVERREGHPIAGATQTEREVKRDLQHPTMTHRHHLLVLMLGDEAGQGAASSNEKPGPALAT